MALQSYPVPSDEAGRLDALAEYHLLDSPPERDFDRIAELAARLFKVPTVLISFLERDRQFFKARVGFDPCETSRDVSFCAHAIMHDEVMVVPDARCDARFATNPLVTDAPFIRFYAGKPLVSPGGHKVGTVCVIDSEPHAEFTAQDRKNLSDIASLILDTMELRRLEQAKAVSQMRFENIAATSPDAIVCSNQRGEITFFNGSAERLFGYSAEEIKKATAAVLVPDSWLRVYEAELLRLQQGERLELADRTIELSGRRRDGSEFPAEFSLSTWQEGPDRSVGVIVRDITERRQNEDRLFRLASLDPLTELPNRGAWTACLAHVLGSHQPATLFLLDLDAYKDVNDMLGHSAGDSVLRAVAIRLTTTFHQAIMVARLGGDEFAILLPGNTPNQAQTSAARLIDALANPFEFGGQLIEVTASIGIALAPMHGSRPQELLSAADLALHRCKAARKGGFEVFTPAFREAALARRAFEQELRRAFEAGQFELFYQPQVATDTRELTGVEALIRWNHPQRGLLAPGAFIEVLSQKPSAAAVGEWVLRTACRQAAAWRLTKPDLRVGVNLFQAQFRSGRLLGDVRAILAETGLPASALELEIVENVLLHDDPVTLRLLQDLRAMGVGLAFDDYGTGYASLSLLKRYPVTRLKIDRSFIRDVNMDGEDAAVVKAVIYLGRSFGLEVIAEGVETEAQREFLKQNRCEESQGYLFGKPMSAADFQAAYLQPVAHCAA